MVVTAMSQARAAQVLTEEHVTGAPEVVIEIGTPGTRKRLRKVFE